MKRPTAFLFVRLLALVLSVAAAGVPDTRADHAVPENSYVDPCIVTCPAGDSAFVLVAHWASGPPAPDEYTVIEFCACSGLVLAEVPPGGDPYSVNSCYVSKTTTSAGVASFPLQAGGLCNGGPIRVYCAGFEFASRTHVASFDQDGDLVVSGADLALIDGKQGTNDLTADFDCDGAVDAADVGIATGHLGHVHASIVGVGADGDVAFGVRPVPNPSRGPVNFVLRTPTRGRALLGVYDLAGRRIATVLDREVEPGVLHAPWAGRAADGRTVPAGLYLYRLRLGERSAHGALVVVH